MIQTEKHVDLSQLDPEEFVGPLPPENKAAIGNILNGLEIIRERIKVRDWPPRRDESEIDEILPQVQEEAQHLFDSLKPFKRQGKWKFPPGYTGAMYGNLSHCKYNELYELRSTIERGAGNLSPYKIWDEAELWRRWADQEPVCEGLRPDKFLENMRWSRIREIHESAAQATVWEVYRGQKRGQKWFVNNPFLHRFNLLKLGATRLQFLNIRDSLAADNELSTKLVLDFPLVYSPHLVACVVFGDGEKGDNKLLFVHKIHESCSKIRYFRFPREIFDQ